MTQLSEMEVLAVLIIAGAIWWGVSEVRDTPRKRVQPLALDPPPIPPKPLDAQSRHPHEVHDTVVTFQFKLEVDPKLDLHDSVADLGSRERLDITIPDQNAEALSLAYEPYEWPSDGRYRSDLNFWITAPHIRDSEKRWYARAVSEFNEKLKVFGEFEGEWVRAETKVALVPAPAEAGMKVVLNGVVLHKLLPGSESLIRRMKRQKLDIKVTKCHATLEGGGTLSDGKPRGIYVSLALKPFRRI